MQCILQSYLQSIFFSPTFSFIVPAIFLSVSIKVKTFKIVFDNNGQTDKSVPIIFLNTNIAQTGHGSLQVLLFFVLPLSANTPEDVPPYKHVKKKRPIQIYNIQD